LLAYGRVRAVSELAMLFACELAMLFACELAMLFACELAMLFACELAMLADGIFLWVVTLE
jgi:hypothetical protein